MDVDVLISVEPILLVHEAEGVEKLVDDNVPDDTAVLLESELHPAAALPVGEDGVAAAISRDDVDIVVLICPGHEPNAAVLLDVGKAGGDDCSLFSGECCVYRVVENSSGPVIAADVSFRNINVVIDQTNLT